MGEDEIVYLWNMKMGASRIVQLRKQVRTFLPIKRERCGKFLVICCLFAAFALSPATGSFSAERSQSVVVITVDMCSKEDLPITEYMYGRLEGVDCGAKVIMDICDKYGVKATFFYDPYQSAQYGEEPLKRFAQDIVLRGHDLQLHTHPAPMFDKKRDLLSQYTHAEQKEILTRGNALLEKWTGKKAIAHRAGAYAANQDTLHALIDTGFILDFSLFLDYPFCLLNRLPLPKNVVTLYGEALWEIPVTSFRLEERSPLGKPIVRTRKVDIDWADEGKLKEALGAYRGRLTVITLFLHGYSFIKHKGIRFRPDFEDMQEFDNLLSYLSAEGISVKTASDLADGFDAWKKAPQVDAVITLTREIPVADYARRWLGMHKVGTAYALAVLCAILLILGALVYWRKKTVRKRVRYC